MNSKPNNCRYFRIRMGWSKQKLATNSGVSTKTIDRSESQDGSVTDVTFWKLIHAMNAHRSDAISWELFFGPEPQKQAAAAAVVAVAQVHTPIKKNTSTKGMKKPRRH